MIIDMFDLGSVPADCNRREVSRDRLTLAPTMELRGPDVRDE